MSQTRSRSVKWVDSEKILSSPMKDPQLTTIVLDQDSADSASNADLEKENEEDSEMIYQYIFGNAVKSISSEKEQAIQATPATKLGNSEKIQALKPFLVFSTSEGNNAPSTKKSNESSGLSSTELLKIEEHKRRMEMAEELHRIDLQIRNENLRAAILGEREVMEIRKIKE